MGRSRMQRRVARGDEYPDPDDGYDSLSSTSRATCWVDGNPNVQEEVPANSSALEGSLDALYGKRTAVREAGLQGLIRALSREVLVKFIANKYETLAHQLLGCIKKGGSSEVALAARALGLLVLTLGVSDAASQVKADAEQHLTKVAKLATSSSARIAALDSLAIIAFVCNVYQDTENAMTILWQIVAHKGHEYSEQKLGAQKPPDAVKAAALSGWTLLLTTLPSFRISAALETSSLPVLSSLLQSHDLAVRRAAGEAAATLYEATHDSTDGTAAHYEDEESFSADPKDNAEVVKDQVLHQMKALSVSSGRKWQTRKERTIQRKSFRQLLTTLEDGVPREMKIKIPNCKALIIKTWSETIQLNGLKRYLGEGFQAHMQNNGLLHEIFEVEVEEMPVLLSTKEKKMLHSPNSAACKARTKLLNRARLNNQAEKGAHFNVNGCESD